MSISMLDVILIAVASALSTLSITYYLIKNVWLPAVKQEIDKEFDDKLEQAVSVVSAEVRESVRQGVLQAITEIPSADTLKGTTQTMAKTGVEIMGLGLDVMRGKKR